MNWLFLRLILLDIFIFYGITEMGKTKKRNTDPSAPKPPRNPYLEFASREREWVLKETTDHSLPEVAREIGRRWKTLDILSRQMYEDEYKERKAQYLREKAEYDQAKYAHVGSKEKSRIDSLAHKKPLSSYMEFCEHERSNVVADGFNELTEIGKELGRRWRGLSAEEKCYYVNRSKQNREVYEKQKNKNESQDNDTVSEVTGEPILGVDDPQEDDSEPSSQGEKSLTVDDLGFARRKNFPWQPAVKLGEIARGTRFRVKFFGTGMSGIVDQSKWTQFTEQAETRIKTASLMKSGAFQLGLTEMRRIKQKLIAEPGVPVYASHINFMPTAAGRSFRRLNKDHLQKEEEVNDHLFAQKMRRFGDFCWRCKDCKWQGRYRTKARAHARDCGVVKRYHPKRNTEKKFQCSALNCKLLFSRRAELIKHYRYVQNL